MEIGGQPHAPVAFPRGSRARCYWIIGQEGLRAGPDALENREMSLPQPSCPPQTSIIISGLYMGRGRFESRPGQRLSRMKYLCFFSNPPRQMLEQYNKSHHDHVISNPFPFIINYNPVLLRHILLKK
jgi:hypothetical protein